MLVCVETYAQRISGVVLDSGTTKPVPMATCRFVDAAGHIGSYCITDRNGHFSLERTPTDKFLIVSFLGYSTVKIDAAKTGTNMRIELNADGNSLEEVVVTPPPIVKHKDTIDYNVASFVTKDDRHLEDVLKRMPGIEVSDNGTVKYQGKPIGRFHIEGRDLLGGRYNQATRNMPVEAVATVQVLENNQPIRALENREFSDKATINIKLSNDYKAKPFGEVELSCGGFSPFRWDDHFTLLDIAKKGQTLVTAETNNIGNDLADLGTDRLDLSDMRTRHVVPTGLLDDMTLRPQPLSKKRFLDNKAYTIGLNHLFVLSKYSTLTANIAYTESHDHHQDSTFASYGGSTRFDLNETNRLKKKYRNFSPSVKYELNSPKVYLLDEVKAGVSRIVADNRLNSNGIGMEMSQRQKPWQVQNDLDMVVNAGHTYKVHSLVRWFNEDETMFSPFKQDLSQQQLLMENSVGTNIPLRSMTIGLTYTDGLNRGNYIIDDMKFHSSAFTNSFAVSTQIPISRARLNVSLPLCVSHTDIPWEHADNKTRLYVSPSAKLFVPLSALTNVNFSVSYNENTTDEPVIPEPYYSNYRTCHYSADHIGWRKQWNAMFSLSYQSVLHLFSWYFVANASWTKNDHYFNFEYEPSATVVTPVWKDNSQRFFYAVTSLHKTFGKGVSLKSSFNYNRMEMLTAQNGTTDTYKSNVLSSSTNFLWSSLSWLSVSYTLTENISWYDGNHESQLKSLYNQASFKFYPLHQLSFNCSLDNQIIEILKGHYSNNTFVDASAEYSFSRRFRVSIKATNVLNRKRFVNATHSVLNYNYYSRPLLGRQMLIGFSLSY